MKIPLTILYIKEVGGCYNCPSIRMNDDDYRLYCVEDCTDNKYNLYHENATSLTASCPLVKEFADAND